MLHLTSLRPLSCRHWTCGPWELLSTVLSSARQVCTFSISQPLIKVWSKKGSSKVRDKCSFHRLQCLLTTPTDTAIRTLSITIFFLCCILQPSSGIIHFNEKLLLFFLVVFMDTEFLWHSSNSAFLPCVFYSLPAVPLYRWVHIGFAQQDKDQACGFPWNVSPSFPFLHFIKRDSSDASAASCTQL